MMLTADDRAERRLLTDYYAPGDGLPGAAFTRRTLEALIAAQAEIPSARAFADDRAEARLLRGHWRRRPDGLPRPGFAESLLREMREAVRARSRADAGANAARRPLDGEGLAMVLKHGYRPVEADPEFRRHLYGDLLRRQRDLVFDRRRARRRAWGVFGVGGALLAAAASVVLLLTGVVDSLAVRSGETDSAALRAPAQAVVPAPAPDRSVISEPARVMASDDQRRDVPWPASRNGEMVDVFDLEYRDAADAPWRRIDRGMARLAPGAAFRNASADDMGCGFAFEDGIRVSVSPSGELRMTDDGLRLARGRAVAMVPGEAHALAWGIDDHDLSIEPGSHVVLASVEHPERYAAGGAPAPELAVTGGLALTRNRAGVGALFPGRAYRLDRYVSAEIPGRPLSNRERDEFALDPRPFPLPGTSGVRAVRASSSWDAAEHPAERLGFTRIGDRWVAPDYRPGAPTKSIAYLSPEHIQLLRERRDLLDALSLGRGVVIRDGDVFLEIL